MDITYKKIDNEIEITKTEIFVKSLIDLQKELEYFNQRKNILLQEIDVVNTEISNINNQIELIEGG